MTNKKVADNSQSGAIWQWAVIGLVALVLFIFGAHYLYYHVIAKSSKHSVVNSGTVGSPK